MLPRGFQGPNGPALFGMPRHARADARPLVPEDDGKLLDFTVSGLTVPVTAFSELPQGFCVCLSNSSGGNITMQAAGSELIDGVNSGVVPHGMLLWLVRGASQLHAYRAPGSSVIEVLTSGTTWDAPMGVRRLKIKLAGGGQGGQGGATGSSVNGAPGPNGNYLEALIPILPGTTYACAIGAGGAGGANAPGIGAVGSAGGATTFTANGVTYSTGSSNGQINISTGAPALTGYGNGGAGGIGGGAGFGGDGQQGAIALEY